MIATSVSRDDLPYKLRHLGICVYCNTILSKLPVPIDGILKFTGGGTCKTRGVCMCYSMTYLLDKYVKLADAVMAHTSSSGNSLIPISSPMRLQYPLVQQNRLST